MKRKRTQLIDPHAKAILYILIEDERERPITILARETYKKTEIGMTSAIRRIEMMEEDGLIEERDLYERRMVKITDKGKRVAEKLREIDEIMGE